ncbi:hypothetical protein ACFL5Z_11910 [Planctomycetota bacterium]
MKTLTLTITTLIVFLLANTNSAVDIYASEPGAVDTAIAVEETPVRTAPPGVPSSSVSVATQRGGTRSLVQSPGIYKSLGTSGPEATERVHVIPTEEITVENLELIKEDMNIMCHLLHKELQPKYDAATRYRTSRYGSSYSRSGAGYST